MSEQPYHGTREPLLDDIHEIMFSIRTSAEIGLLYAEAGDALGIEYQTRKLIAYVKAVIPSVKALRATPDASHGGKEAA